MAAAEGAFAFRYIKRDPSFRSWTAHRNWFRICLMEHLPVNGQKSEIIATFVLGSPANDELSKELSEVACFTVSLKAGNRKSIKLTPILIRLFHFMKGVKSTFLDVHSAKAETPEIIADASQGSILNYEITEHDIELYVYKTNKMSTGYLVEGKLMT
jgi:hypothetical protein